MPAPSPSSEQGQAEREALGRLDRLAWFLDNAIRLPGGFRIGFDSLVGLIPGLGDGLGMLTSSYILLEAIRAGVGRAVLLRMVANVAIESAVGIVPIVGDLFDMVWKSNTRNVALLRAHATAPERVGQRSWGFLALCVLVLLSAAALVLWLTVALLGALFGLLS
jgi:hypothetical protein